MTPTELRSILKSLGLPPHSKRTELALGIGRRQIANYLAGKKPISEPTIQILRLLNEAQISEATAKQLAELETEKHGERK